MYKELNTIRCYIDLSPKDWGLYDRDKIHRIFSKDIKKYCRENGVKIKISDLGGMGGGMDSLIDIIKFVWDNKSLIGLIGLIPKIIGWTTSFIKNKIKDALEEKRPVAFISFELQSDKSYKDDEIEKLNKIIPERLTKLISLSSSLIKKLSLKHPPFLFDRSFSATVLSRSFWVRYSIDYKTWTDFNQYRLARLINTFKIKKNFYSYFSFDKWFLISRIDGRTSLQKWGNDTIRNSTKDKKYYLLFSTRVIRDYFQ